MSEQMVLESGQSVIEVMDEGGDTKLIWSRHNRDEVEAARDLYNRMKKKGYYGYSVVGERGDKGEVLRDFDPNAERIIMAPPHIGG